MCHRLVINDSFERNNMRNEMQNLSTHKGISLSNDQILVLENQFNYYII